MTNAVTHTAPTVLAVGASGKFAGLVVPELAKRGAKVRAFIRDAKKSDAVRQQGAAEVAVGDLTDRSSLDAALEDIDAVFYIAPAFISSEAEVGKSVVAAAQAAGVRRIVFSSVIDPVISVLVNHRDKVPVEEAIIESGMEYVLLQPTLFMQGVAGNWPKIVESGVYAEPWASETRFSRVDYRDVAEVAALALTEDRLLYGTYQLCAEGCLNRFEVAALMSEVLGKEIKADQLVASKMPSSGGDQPSPMQTMVNWYNHHGLLGNALPLRAALGREPRTLRAFIEELAASNA